MNDLKNLSVSDLDSDAEKTIRGGSPGIPPLINLGQILNDIGDAIQKELLIKTK